LKRPISMHRMEARWQVEMITQCHTTDLRQNLRR
jgi:hypothetical protein